MNTIPSAEMHYKTCNPSLLQKIMQAYWANPASWLLDEFIVSEGVIVITRKNGDRFEAPFSNIESTFAVDNYDRREINIRCGEKKTRFKEIPGMLSEEEWDSIIEILNPKKSGIGKLNDMLRSVKEKLGGWD